MCTFIVFFFWLHCRLMLYFWLLSIYNLQKNYTETITILSKYLLPNSYWHSLITICVNNTTQEIYNQVLQKYFLNNYIPLFVLSKGKLWAHSETPIKITIMLDFSPYQCFLFFVFFSILVIFRVFLGSLLWMC